MQQVVSKQYAVQTSFVKTDRLFEGGDRHMKRSLVPYIPFYSM
jgi:hypothetical protein